MPGAREAAARQAAQAGVAVPLVAASLVVEGVAAGLAAQLGTEGARPAAREAGRATAETKGGPACLVGLVAAGARRNCATRGWVARSATWQSVRRGDVKRSKRQQHSAVTRRGGAKRHASPVLVCGSGAGRLDRRLVLLLTWREGRGAHPQLCRGWDSTLRHASHVEVNGDDWHRCRLQASKRGG